ncbi:MAG: CHASE domain-containing protein [Pseudomonadota bacterium]|nr:CHASE domain-containing protein [Pseudomonadota bacterium]
MDRPLKKKGDNRGWLARSPRRLQIAVLFLVGAVSLLGVFGIENAEMHRRHAALERNASNIAATLRQLDTEHEIYLRASAALLERQDTVTAQDFAQMQSQLDFDRYRQGSLGVGWAPRVPAAHPGPARNDAYPVVFLNPLTPDNAAAVGFDMYSEPVRRAAMAKAAAIAAPVASGPVRLIQRQGNASQAGFLIYMPVFGRAISRQPSPALHGPLRGYVFMRFRAPALLAMASTLAGYNKIRVEAYDGQLGPGRLMAQLGDPIDGGTRLVEQVDVAHRPWQLVISAGPHVGLSRLSQITILSGLIVGLLLVLLIRITYQKVDEDRQVLDWKASEAGIRNSLTRELNHRVKNTLATVLSIVTLTRRRETDLDSYVESLSGRIRALSATHDLLTSNDWSSIELRQIIIAELAPYIGANDDHVGLDGPEIQLAPNDSLTLGLAVHELATNAAKYGALSVLDGRIAVHWQKSSDQVVEIHWQETGGPVVAEPSKRGFGRELIEKILARELDSPVKLEFRPDGLRCVFQVPLRKPAPFVLRTGQQSGASP